MNRYEVVVSKDVDRMLASLSYRLIYNRSIQSLSVKSVNLIEFAKAERAFRLRVMHFEESIKDLSRYAGVLGPP